MSRGAAKDSAAAPRLVVHCSSTTAFSRGYTLSPLARLSSEASEGSLRHHLELEFLSGRSARPSFFIRAASVPGLIPSNSAAPAAAVDLPASFVQHRPSAVATLNRR